MADNDTNDATENEQTTLFPDIKPKLEILDALFHPTEENVIALGLINGKLKLYKVSDEKKRLISVQKLHKKSIRKLAFSTDNSNYVFTASKDKTIKLTDLNEQKNILTLENAHKKPINCLTAIDTWLLASADDNGCVKIWDYRQKKATMEVNNSKDYISDLAVSDDKKVLLATSGEGTLNAYHTRGKKLIMQSEFVDSEMLCVTYMKNGSKVVCGTGEGVLNIFNRDEWGNMSDRFTGHTSSVDAVVRLTDDILLSGCFDGNIRACHILPNRFVGVVGSHKEFPVQRLCVSNDRKICASISYDECVKFWNVEHLLNIKLDPSSKSKSKKLKNKKLTNSGKTENFFADLIDDKNANSDDEQGDSDDDSDDDDDDDDDKSDDEQNGNGNGSDSDESSDSDDDSEAAKPKRKKIKK